MTNSGRYIVREVVPFAAMVMVECTNAGLSTLFKAATLKGLSYHVFMVYSYALSTLLFIPLVFLFNGKRELPPFTIALLGKFFLLGTFGFTSQLLGYKGIEFSSPTMGSAMSNLTPACTFALAIFFRMEKVVLRNLSSQAKIMGTVVSIMGAFVMVLYEGPVVIRHSASALSLRDPPPTNLLQANWAIGGAMLAGCYILVSIWYILQAQTVKEYPSEILVVFFNNLFCTLIAAPLCFIVEPNFNSWKIKPDVQLIAILYSGTVGSSLGIIIHTWGLHVKGPVYVATFRPLSIAVAAIMGVIFLGDSFYLGSVIGVILISAGFYVVMWGKSQEENMSENGGACNLESPSDEIVPLLKNLE